MGRRLHSALAVACAAALLAPLPAAAWGAKGHRLVNGAAMRMLPANAPAFLRTRAAHDEVMLLGPEADRLRDSGQPADQDADHGHFVDIADDGTVGGIPLGALPPSREAYDTALRAQGLDQYKAGYVPYMIADGYEHLTKEFAYWRVDVAGEKTAAPADRAFFTLDRTVREAAILHDIGYWGHFVGDASQPLHISVHFNGWDSTSKTAPNPNGYSNSRTVHARFESALVDAVANEDLVAARVPAAPAAANGPILSQVGTYLTASWREVPRVYELEQAGAIDARSDAARAFVLDRLAAGAAEMRDLIVEAWNASDAAQMGYGAHAVPVTQIENGTVVPTPSLVGEGAG